MDIHDEHKRDDTSSRGYRSVTAPRPNEAISSALRLAYEQPDAAMPHDFSSLLQQLN